METAPTEARQIPRVSGHVAPNPVESALQPLPRHLRNLPRERPGEVLAVLSIRGEVSENSVGKPVPGFLCQREAELARSVEVESPLDSKPGRDFAFANRLVSVRVWIGSKMAIPAI